MPISSHLGSKCRDNDLPRKHIMASKPGVAKHKTDVRRKRRLLTTPSQLDQDEPDESDLGSERRLRNTRLGDLYAGSRFRGTQTCGSTNYDVIVDIQHVDLGESTICGYLNIKGLTNEFPELTTFFEAEIIGPKYPFQTRKWQAQYCIDAAHWKRFPSFEPYIDTFDHPRFVYDPYESDFIYMRWKEKFLVPDHRVDSIEGASFAGFYYICYQRSTRKINGFYFFRHFTEWYQELTLEHVEQQCFGNFEFR